ARLSLEERHDEHYRELFRQRLHAVGGRSRDRLSDVEALELLRLREVRRVEELLEANDLRAARGGFAHTLFGGGDVRRDIAARRVLDDADCKRSARHRL